MARGGLRTLGNAAKDFLGVAEPGVEGSTDVIEGGRHLVWLLRLPG